MTELPSILGYRWPAEWESHEATWLTWPYKDDSFPGLLQSIYDSYLKFIKEISKSEKVRINVPNEIEKNKLFQYIQNYNIPTEQIEVFINPSNDVWCRDHGPIFLVNSKNTHGKVVLKWEFNGWGNKYPADLDNKIAESIAKQFGFKIYRPGIILEGGSIDGNGRGTVLTTKSCLLNENRNPHLSLSQIEKFLRDFLAIEQILWLEKGIEGDDTDGHIDDITRFVNEDTVITMIEVNKGDSNYEPLRENLKLLNSMRLSNGKQFNIVDIPMPKPVIYKGDRMPASYANFYICNNSVIVPTFRCNNDDVALKIISEVFPNRNIVGIDSYEIIVGLGSFHCLSQQEPGLS